MGRVGELLLLGIKMVEGGAAVNCATHRPGGTYAAKGLLKQAFDNGTRWTPAQLARELHLSRYQVKTALKRLVSEGAVAVSGRTRGAVYAAKPSACLREASSNRN